MDECWFSRSNAEATSLGKIEARIHRCEVGFEKWDVDKPTKQSWSPINQTPMTNSLTNLDFHVYVDVDVNFYLSSATMPNVHVFDVQANWKSSWAYQRKSLCQPDLSKSKPKSRSYTNRWAQVTCCATSLWPRWRSSKHVFFVFFCILTPVLILPVHLLWVGNARLRCSSGHDRPLPLPQEGLHFVIILRSQRTPSFKPKMKQR